MATLLVIDMANIKKVSVAVSSAIVVTTVVAVGYSLFGRVRDWKKYKGEIESIPWDVSKRYTSWRAIF